jgi:citrate lyase beta subunit
MRTGGGGRYAYARLEHSVSPELADTIRQRIACSIDKFEPQGLAITMWAFVNLEAHPPGRALLDQMAQQGVRLAAEV